MLKHVISPAFGTVSEANDVAPKFFRSRSLDIDGSECNESHSLLQSFSAAVNCGQEVSLAACPQAYLKLSLTFKKS